MDTIMTNTKLQQIVKDAQRQLKQELAENPDRQGRLVLEGYCDGVKVKLVQDDLLMLSQCMSFGAAIAKPDYLEIVVDSNFFKLDATGQDFIIYHEVGHYKNGHLKSNLLAKLRLMVRLITNSVSVSKQEIQADEYALSRLTKEKCVYALECLDNILGGHTEIKKRIQIIQNY